MKHYNKLRLRLLTAIIIIIIAIISLVRCCSCSCAPTQNDSTQVAPFHLNDSLTNAITMTPELHDLDSIMQRYMKRWEINGAQLAVSRNDSLLYARGYGWADMEREIEMQPSHIMRIASVSKLVTAVGIMKLQEEGRLHLSDRVFGPQGILNDTTYTKVIKDKRYFDITVEQLLRHSAGFTNYAGDPMFSTRYIMMQNHLTTPPDNHTLLGILLKRHLGFTPGTARCYSNLGFTLLSMIIEKRTGLTYDAYMQKHVLQPAGCFDFHIAGNYYKDRRPNEVKYYMHQGSVPVYEYNNSGRMVQKCYGENDIPRLKGAGAWCASAAELSRLIAAIDNYPGKPDILSAKSITAMTQPMPDHAYSLGWNYTPTIGPWVRTGSLGGTSALVLKYADGECWIFITNTSTWKGHDFSNDTMRLFEQLRKKYGNKFPRRDLFTSIKGKGKSEKRKINVKNFT